MWIFVILMVLSAIAYVPIYWGVTPELRRYIGPSFVISFAILIFAGTFVSTNTFLVLCVAVMVLFTRGRVDATCRFILLGALIPNSPLPLMIGGTYLVPVSPLDVLGIGLAIALMIKPDRPRTEKVRGWTVDDATVILFFAALNIATERLSEGLNGLMRQLLSGTLLFLMPYFLLRHSVRRIDEFRLVIGCLAVAAAILSVYALYEADKGWSLFASINGNLGEQNVGLRNLMIRGNTLRASASMQGALSLGCYLSIGWIAMACSQKLIRGRLPWIAGCTLVFLGELAAQSRGSLACIALAAVILLAAYRRPILAGAMLVAAACGAGLLIAAANFSTKIAGFLNMNPERQASDPYDYRQLLFRRGMEEAAKHRWTGTNINSVLVRLEDIKQGQGIIDFVNVYLFIYLVMGLIGIIPITLAIIWMFRNLLNVFRRADSDTVVAVRSFALAAAVATLVQLAFMSFIDRVPVLFALILASTRLVVLTQRKGRANLMKHSGPQDRVGRLPEALPN